LTAGTDPYLHQEHQQMKKVASVPLTLLFWPDEVRPDPGENQIGE